MDYKITAEMVVSAESEEQAMAVVKDLLVYENGAEWLSVRSDKHYFTSANGDTCICGKDLRHECHIRA